MSDEMRERARKWLAYSDRCSLCGAIRIDPVKEINRLGSWDNVQKAMIAFAERVAKEARRK